METNIARPGVVNSPDSLPDGEAAVARQDVAVAQGETRRVWKPAGTCRKCRCLQPKIVLGQPFHFPEQGICQEGPVPVEKAGDDFCFRFSAEPEERFWNDDEVVVASEQKRGGGGDVGDGQS